MRYYAQYDDNGILTMIGTGAGGVEITENEYNALMNEIYTKATLVEQVYFCDISIDDVPEEWREEIQQRVDERIVINGIFDKEEISDSEALAIILGGEV